MNKILSFKITGKFAHFKKYYSNSSSLTYNLPTRTNLMGLVASILEISRDDYYEILSSDNCKFSVKILSETKKHFECMNYLHPDQKKALHTQTRLELLIPKNKVIEYEIFVLFGKNSLLQKKLFEKLNNKDLGYGIYFGQRQFRAHLKEKPKEYELEILKNEIHNYKITSITWTDNIIEFSNNVNCVNLNTVIDYNKLKDGREPKSMQNIIYSKTGFIEGKFKEVIKIKKENDIDYISFFTPLKNE